VSSNYLHIFFEIASDPAFRIQLEVVLSLLIESFRFSPSDKEVIWQMHGIASPTVKSNSKSGTPLPQLPLVVELVN
jgi:hypothetical protein